MNFFCEKRLYAGEALARREYKASRLDIFAGSGPTEFDPGAVTKVYVKRFLTKLVMTCSTLRGRFLTHTLGWHFTVVKTEPSQDFRQAINLEVFAISQEEADTVLGLLKEAVNMALNLDAAALEDEVKRARAIRHEGGNARDRRSRRRKLLLKPAWWEQLGGED